MSKRLSPHCTFEELLDRLDKKRYWDKGIIRKASKQATQSFSHSQADDGSPQLEQHIYPVVLEIINYLEKHNRFDPDMVAATILHDVLEDDLNIDEEDFRKSFGDKIYFMVKTLSKKKLQDFSGINEEEKRKKRANEYHSRLQNASKDTKIIKFADRLNNISRLHTSGDEEKKVRYILETEKFYLPLAFETDNFFGQKLMQVLQRVKKKNNFDRLHCI